MDSVEVSSKRAVSLARKDLPNYSFDRVDKRVFRGFSGDAEVFPINGVFHLKKKGEILKAVTYDLMRWTDVFKCKSETKSRKGQNRVFNDVAIKKDYKEGMSLYDIMDKHGVSESTVRRYTK